MIKSRSAPMQIFDTAKIKLLIMFLGLQNIKKACMLIIRARIVFLVVDKHLLPLSAISCIVTYEWIVRKYFLNLYLSEDSEFVKNMKNIKPKRIRKYKNAID